MEYVTLNNGVKMPMVGLGTFPLQGDLLKKSLSIAYKAGGRLIDTASGYHNENDIGDLIRESVLDRKDIFITSKVHSNILTGTRRRLYLNKKSLKRAYKNSCDRLNVNYVDLYLIHQPFKGCIKAYRKLMKLNEKGRVRAIGVSNFDIQELEILHDKLGVYPMVNQTEISPYNSQKELIAYCKLHNIQVEAYSPFGRGNLVNELMNNQLLVSIAKNHNKTVGQVVLRWIVQQGVVVIARSTNEERIRQNIDIFDFSLTDDEMGMVDSLNKNIVFGVNQIHKYDKPSPIA